MEVYTSSTVAVSEAVKICGILLDQVPLKLLMHCLMVQNSLRSII